MRNNVYMQKKAPPLLDQEGQDNRFITLLSSIIETLAEPETI